MSAGKKSRLVVFTSLLLSFILALGAVPALRSIHAGPLQKANGKINKNGNDRCDHLPDPPGKAKGIDKKCPPSGGSSSGVAKGDFNGDGFADLAIGVPGEDTDGVTDSGLVL